MTLAGLLVRAEGVPLVRLLSRIAINRRFEANTNRNLFRGVFSSFAAAEASAPKTRPLGYDNPAAAGMYLQRLEIDDCDYPSMFWIALSLTQGMRRIADIGGAVGIKFFAFSSLIEFPAEMVWRVIDLPTVVKRGREFAIDRGAAPSLEFSDNLLDASGMDVIFASGVLQYMPETLAAVLDRLPRKPARIIVNTTPIHRTRSFFTLQSIGTAYCAYRVQGRDEFVDAIVSRGYCLRDEWSHVRPMRIPFEPELSIENYTGFCFDADAARRGVSPIE